MSQELDSLTRSVTYRNWVLSIFKLVYGLRPEAVRVDNDTIYGLSGSVWTENGAKAMRVARALDAGTLSVNSNWSVRIATPYGGFKQSGIGRALGPDALDYYTELKNVYIAT